MPKYKLLWQIDEKHQFPMAFSTVVSLVGLLALSAVLAKPHKQTFSHENVGYSILNHTVHELSASCSVTSASQVASAVASCTNINVGSFSVPASYQPLISQLKQGTTLTFTGELIFEKHAFSGYLMEIIGNNVKVQGSSSHLLNGRGELYWDSLGEAGSTKPTFLYLKGISRSTFSGLNLKNCPMRCVAIDESNDITVSGFLIDNREGAPGTAASGKEGHNTDGFDVAKTEYLTLNNHVVYNQDDCVAINSGAHMLIDGVNCDESHGLDIATGMSTTDTNDNIVNNITFRNSNLHNSMYGIHILTCNDGGKGSVSNINYDHIIFSGSTHYGIMIQQDFSNAEQRTAGGPTGKVPISNVFFTNVEGVMNGDQAYALSVRCAKNACSNIVFDEVDVTGAVHENECINYTIGGFC